MVWKFLTTYANIEMISVLNPHPRLLAMKWQRTLSRETLSRGGRTSIKQIRMMIIYKQLSDYFHNISIPLLQQWTSFRIQSTW